MGNWFKDWACIVAIFASFGLFMPELYGDAPPPVDRTSVDRVLDALGGTIPFPPETLFTTLESRGFRIQGAAVVPTGRNFEKGTTSYSRPRSEFAVNPGPFDSSGMPVDPSKTVFFAYTPSNQQMQVIGASTSKPFDFRLFEHYSAGSPSSGAGHVANSQSVCLTCHQNAATIFPAGLWNETNQNRLIQKKMLDQPHLDPFARFLLGRYDRNGEVFPGGRTAVVGFNDAVLLSSAADRMAPGKREQTCRDICGNGRECRRAMLITGITDVNLDDSSALHNATVDYFTPSKSKDILDDIEKHARRDLTLESEAQLINRRSLDQETCITPGAGYDPLAFRPGAPHFSLGGSPLGSKLGVSGPPGMMKSARKLSPELTHVADGVLQAGAACFPFNADSAFLKELKQIPPQKVVEAFSSPHFNELLTLRAWPPTAAQVLSALKGEKVSARKPTAPKTKISKEGSFSPEFRAFMNNRSGTHAGAAFSAEKSYIVYCASCHKAGSAPVLPLENLITLRDYSGVAGRTAAALVGDRIMPPPGSSMPTDEERERMVSAMAGGHPKPAPVCAPPEGPGDDNYDSQHSENHESIVDPSDSGDGGPLAAPAK